MRIYDETCLALCEGQYLDISFERRDDVTVEAYLEMIGKKTAALMGASVQAGAILAVDDPEVHEAYRRFGYDLGMAFQMADDVKGTFWTLRVGQGRRRATSAGARRRCRWSGRWTTPQPRTAPGCSSSTRAASETDGRSPVTFGDAR